MRTIKIQKLTDEGFRKYGVFQDLTNHTQMAQRVIPCGNFYPDLLRAGIKVYEYTPGFVHAKVFVSDDVSATVGTVNLDYRSFYHHFECGVFFHENSVVRKVEEDFRNTLQQCQEVTMNYYRKIPLYQKMVGMVARLLAPLM